MTNTTNPNFTASKTRITWGSGINEWRTLSAPLAGTAAWDLGADVDETNLFAIESNVYPGCYSYARVTPVARKETPVPHSSGSYGYRVRVEFINLCPEDNGPAFTAWVVL